MLFLVGFHPVQTSEKNNWPEWKTLLKLHGCVTHAAADWPQPGLCFSTKAPVWCDLLWAWHSLQSRSQGHGERISCVWFLGVLKGLIVFSASLLTLCGLLKRLYLIYVCSGCSWLWCLQCDTIKYFPIFRYKRNTILKIYLLRLITTIGADLALPQPRWSKVCFQLENKGKIRI